MTILGIETSCDETSAAVLSLKKTADQLILRSNSVASSLAKHAQTGGIIPEIAAREQIRCIMPVLREALKKGLSFDLEEKKAAPPIDAIAVTYGPGLIGSLLVGVETAKTLSYVWNKPLIPVNHMIGHIYANFISTMNHNPSSIRFPAIALVVSGGHTDLILLKKHGEYHVLGGTRDDAAGEALDKIGRLLGLPYPAGPVIEKLAQNGDAKRFVFPSPLIGSGDFDFSFSGLKTAVLREVITIKQLNNETINNLCASVQQAVIDVLVRKTITAAEEHNAKSILLSGGVAANQTLREQLELSAHRSLLSAKIFVPQKSLCTDNAAMIAAAAAYNFNPIPWQEVTANPELYY